MLIALLTDAADGFLARTLHQESEIGKVLDPVCDKVSLIVILVTLYLINAIPLWGVIIIAARDLLILTGSYTLYRHKSVVFKSNLLGKITGVIFAALILAYTINLTRLGEMLLYISIPAILGSFAIYLGRYIRAMKGER
jgi:CDP-diacylglycerol--glycerol-3-phosphate 3-phosphatidyltransferase